MLNKLEINELYDFYEPLLTDKQKHIMNDYFREDYSLQEIADNENISKAAVHDLIKRVTLELENYENKLHLCKQYKKRIAIYKEISSISNDDINHLIEQCYDIEENGD